MFKVEFLNGKTYYVKHVTARALRDIGAVQAVLKRWMDKPESADIKKDMDVLLTWFCAFCGSQFTVEELYDNYPSDKIITDVGLAVIAVNAQTTAVLEKFPTGTGKKKARSKTLFTRLTGIFLKKVGSRKK